MQRSPAYLTGMAGFFVADRDGISLFSRMIGRVPAMAEAHERTGDGQQIQTGGENYGMDISKTDCCGEILV